MVLNTESNPGAERIDAVYLWVNGADSLFQRELAIHAARQGGSLASEAARSHRFRDNDELRYSLRSLESYAPWIGNIHIITNGQVPKWLDCSHRSIRLVFHDMIFPDPSCLPTFNSCAIELNLHRIPGLSRRFLYMNDDLYLGRETRPDDFLLSDGSYRFYVEPTSVNRHFAHGPIHDRAYLYTVRVLDGLWRPSRQQASPAYFHTWKDRCLHRRRQRRLPAHTPQLYDRELLADLESLLPDEFNATRSHCFRSPDDLVLRLAYFYSLLESGRYPGIVSAIALDWESEGNFFLMLEDALPSISEKLVQIGRLRPKFFCLNDDLEEATVDHPVLSLQHDFLQDFFPCPSSFEKTEGVS